MSGEGLGGPREPFSAREYLADRAAAVAAGGVCVAGVAGMQAMLGVGLQAALLTAAFMVACGAFALAAGYVRRARFYRELDALARQDVGAGNLAALLEEPGFLEGRLAWQALDAQGRAAADEVGAYKRAMAEYRDYVELWIHEIKTPIAAANLMAADLHGPVAARLKGELDRIEAQVEQALYYARSTSLAKDYVIRETPLAAVARAACRKNARYLIECGVALQMDVPEEATVFADEPWLVFVVGQVVVNAAKYGAKNVRFSACEEGVGTASSRTVLSIADDGRGIPAADVPRVFERGFTGENGRAQGSSTGMGLYLAAVMCGKMGLGLGIASEEGVGTRVMLAFPHDRRRMDLQTA